MNNAGNTLPTNNPEQESTEHSDEAQKWQELADVPFAGEEIWSSSTFHIPEQFTSSSDETSLVETPSANGGGETAEAKKRGPEDILRELEEYSEQRGLEDANDFLSDGEPRPGYAEEDVAFFHSALDEYAGLIQNMEEPSPDLVAQLHGILGGKYDELEIGGITPGQAAEFGDIVSSKGYRNFEECFAHSKGLGSTEMVFSDAMRELEFTTDEIRYFYEIRPDIQPDADPVEAAEVMRQTITAVCFEKLQYELESGLRDDIPKLCIELFNQYVPGDVILESETISDAYVRHFAGVVESYVEDPEKEYNYYINQYLENPTMYAVVLRAQEEHPESMPSQEAIQAYGDALIRADGRHRPNNFIERAKFVSELGADILQEGTYSVLHEEELQRYLAESGRVGPAQADALYRAVAAEMYENNWYTSLIDEIQPSGEDAVANFWFANRDNIGVLRSQAWFTSDTEGSMVDENLMPNERFMSALASQLKMGSNEPYPAPGAMNFVIQNPDLVQGAKGQIYNAIFYYYMGDGGVLSFDRSKGMEPAQEATLDTYLEMVKAGASKEELDDFKSFMLMGHQIYVPNEDGHGGHFEAEYNIKKIPSENIGLVPDVLRRLKADGSSQLSSISNELMSSVMRMPAEEIPGVLDRVEAHIADGEYMKVLEEVKDLDKRLFTKFFAREGWVYADGSEQQRRVVEGYLRAWDSEAEYPLEKANLFVKYAFANVPRPDAPADSYSEDVRRFTTLSPEEISRAATVCHELARNTNIAEPNMPDVITHDVISWLRDLPAESVLEEYDRLDTFFVNKGEEDSFAQNFPELSKICFKSLFGVERTESLSNNESKVIDTYLDMVKASEFQRDDRTTVFKNFVMEKVPGENPDETKYRYEILPEESITEAPEILAQLYESNSLQLTRLASKIAESVLIKSPEEAHEQVKKLEHIFLRRDIPDFAKLYCCANVIYEGTINQDVDVSPVLKSAEDKRNVLMTDLLRISIHSNNNSLRRYLEGVLAGEAAEQGDSEAEEADDSVLADFRNGKKFRTRFFGFANNLGFENVEQILEAMDRYRDERDAMHRQAVVKVGDGVYRLNQGPQPGDFVKGIQMSFVHSLLTDGFNCPEMIGESAKQDVTHWDTDFGSVVDTYVPGSGYDLAIAGSLANSYGDGVHILVRNDERFGHTYPGDASGYTDFATYEAYHGMANGANFRGVRTGLGSEDVDCYIVQQADSEQTLRLKYEVVKHGCYVPIVDRATGNVLLTPDQFDEMRKGMGGAVHYGVARHEASGEIHTDLDVFHFASDLSLPDELTAEGHTSFSGLVEGFEEKEHATRAVQAAMVDKIRARIESSDLPEEVKAVFRRYNTEISEDATPGTIDALSTGSTGRLTNEPGDADYDFVWRIDRALQHRHKDDILHALVAPDKDGNPPLITHEDGSSPIRAGGIREGIMEVTVDGKTIPVSIDISPVVKTDKMDYSSDQALERRLEVIRAQDPDKYKQVVANIVVAKQVLKQAGVYKKQKGGLGGIGVENWILQNGGSLKSAAKSFLDAAKGPNGGYISCGAFTGRYAVYDLGENHFASGYPFDNYIIPRTSATGEQIGGLTEHSYKTMLELCQQITGEQ